MRKVLYVAMACTWAAGTFAWGTQDYVQSLEPCINGAVSASGLFPTQEMEEQFIRYVRWTRENGLHADYAFEAVRMDRGATHDH